MKLGPGLNDQHLYDSCKCITDKCNSISKVVLWERDTMRLDSVDCIGQLQIICLI